MKKLGNTLYVLTEGSYLHCQNETISVRVGGDDKVRIPAHTIESIICFGNTTISTPFVGFCSDHGIGLSFASEYGKFFGRINGKATGNVLLRKSQYMLIDDIRSKDVVTNILYSKIGNCRNMLNRFNRNNNDAAQKQLLQNACDHLKNICQMLPNAQNIDELRGLEGAAATVYFEVMDVMLDSNDAAMKFKKRTKHPPENNFNALLSFLYMLLKNDVQSALECVGLDPAAGYLHTLRPGRASFALDIMEELRSPLCDRMAISLVHLGMIKSSDFDNDDGLHNLTDKGRRCVLDSWQKRKREDMIHPFIKEKIPIGLIPYIQAQLFARYLRGELDAYPAFMWR